MNEYNNNKDYWSSAASVADNDDWTAEKQVAYEKDEKAKMSLATKMYNEHPELYWFAKPFLEPMNAQDAQRVISDRLRFLAVKIHGNEVLSACRFSACQRFTFKVRGMCGCKRKR
jgi:hypothetical protein